MTDDTQDDASHSRYVPPAGSYQGTELLPYQGRPGAGAERVVHLRQSRERRIYIAGPMTGLPEFNFPAFNAKAAELRAQGWHVENPAEHGHVDGAEWVDYLRYDLSRMVTCEAIYLLPGWEKSRGATLELSVGKALGMALMGEPAAGAEPEYQMRAGACTISGPKEDVLFVSALIGEPDDAPQPARAGAVDEQAAIEHALHLESETNTEIPDHLQRGLSMHLHRLEKERQSRAEQLTTDDWDACKHACERAREHIAAATTAATGGKEGE